MALPIKIKKSLFFASQLSPRAVSYTHLDVYKRQAYIISRINGFTYVQTEYDFYTGELKIVSEKAFSDGEKAKVKCYGANDVLEGVAVMRHEWRCA